MRKILFSFGVVIIGILSAQFAYADTFIPTKTNFMFINNGQTYTDQVNFTYRCFGCDVYSETTNTCTPANVDEVLTFDFTCNSGNCFTYDLNSSHAIVSYCTIEGETDLGTFNLEEVTEFGVEDSCIYGSQFDTANSADGEMKYYFYTEKYKNLCVLDEGEDYQTYLDNGCDLIVQEGYANTEYFTEADPSTFEVDSHGGIIDRSCTLTFDLTGAFSSSSNDSINNDFEVPTTSSEVIIEENRILPFVSNSVLVIILVSLNALFFTLLVIVGVTFIKNRSKK